MSTNQLRIPKLKEIIRPTVAVFVPHREEGGGGDLLKLFINELSFGL